MMEALITIALNCSSPIHGKLCIKGLNDYKPVTVTSVVINLFNSLMLTHLNHITDHYWISCNSPPTQTTRYKPRDIWSDPAWWWTLAQRSLLWSMNCFTLSSPDSPCLPPPVVGSATFWYKRTKEAGKSKIQYPDNHHWWTPAMGSLPPALLPLHKWLCAPPRNPLLVRSQVTQHLVVSSWLLREVCTPTVHEQLWQPQQPQYALWTTAKAKVESLWMLCCTKGKVEDALCQLCVEI